MAMFLARLLGRSDDSLLIYTINNFEKTTHSSNVDVVLISDIWKKSHNCIKKLGLDSTDSTPREIYQALINYNDTKKLLKNCEYVAVAIGDEIISLNIEDLKQDKANSSTFEMRSLYFMRQALLNEIEARYVASSVSRDKLAQLMKWLRQRI